jgi:NAD(P)-dependent dehydrogenase (short-subunit alcohol dehydrogenase family)
MSDSMTGKTVLITGATAGIGRATAAQLARQGAYLTIVGRDPGKTARTAAEIRTQTGNIHVDHLIADLSALAEVRRLAAEFTESHPKLDVLINNAGGIWATRRTTVDGLEHTFAVNYLASFLLTSLLLDSLKAAAPSRIVNVTSGNYVMGRIDFDDLQSERKYSGLRAYNQSKLASVLFTYELARRLDSTGVTVNALHPGAVRTDFYVRDDLPLTVRIVALARPVMATPDQGARTSVYLASSPDVGPATGRYFVRSKPKNTSKLSRSRELAARLWQVSADLVRLEQ